MHKYRPLARYLERQASPVVELTFDEIEKIIGDVLPQSAFIHRAWWANCYEGRIHAPAWLDIGFMVDAVDLGGRNVRFHRKEIERQRARREPHEAQAKGDRKELRAAVSRTGRAMADIHGRRD
jgi:hypothetical protein